MIKDQAGKASGNIKAKPIKEQLQKGACQKRVTNISLIVDSRAPIYSAVPGRKYTDLI
jgi:hypothetical protein